MSPANIYCVLAQLSTWCFTGNLVQERIATLNSLALRHGIENCLGAVPLTMYSLRMLYFCSPTKQFDNVILFKTLVESLNLLSVDKFLGTIIEVILVYGQRPSWLSYLFIHACFKPLKKNLFPA